MTKAELTKSQLRVLRSMPFSAEVLMGGLDAPVVVWLAQQGLIEHAGEFRYRITQLGREVLAQ